jgi:tagatose 6-phosphate kinase
MVKPNLEELSGLIGAPLEMPDAQWAAIDRMRQSGVEVVVLSLGEAGARVEWSGRRWEATPPAVATVNSLGSGDSLVAGIAWAWRHGATPREALAWGVACGAANAAVWDPGGFTHEEAEGLLPAVRLVER